MTAKTKNQEAELVLTHIRGVLFTLSPDDIAKVREAKAKLDEIGSTSHGQIAIAWATAELAVQA